MRIVPRLQLIVVAHFFATSGRRRGDLTPYRLGPRIQSVLAYGPRFLRPSDTLKMVHETRPRICIVGGGAAGLAAAKACVRKGWTPTIFERADSIGGVWNYREKRIDEKRTNDISPMYRGLRTNLPVEIMQFRDFSWRSVHRTSPPETGRSFVTHYEVQEYLRDYCRHFDLERFIQFSTTVTNVAFASMHHPPTVSWCSSTEESWPQLQVTTLRNTSEEVSVYDGIMICNGHYSAPSMPKIPGLREYFLQTQDESLSEQATVEHSASYDSPEKYSNRTVLCVGGRASGSDLVCESGWSRCGQGSDFSKSHGVSLPRVLQGT
jgi:cation diffusion facilitator CzcD-associated flavoprotein CzcO